jgi:4-amino-4-deoxychorismate lyase
MQKLSTLQLNNKPFLMSHYSMLLETLKIVNGIAPFLAFHNERLNQTRQILFNVQDKIDLKDFLTDCPPNGIYRSRVIYSKTIESIEYIPFIIRHFQTFKIIKDDKINYEFKYLNRENLNHLVKLKEQADEILIIKNGFVTDTSIANVAFWEQNKWLTPKTPLLKGTTRERLLREKKIIEASIRLEELTKFSKMAIMNALIDFYVIDEFKLIF